MKVEEYLPSGSVPETIMEVDNPLLVEDKGLSCPCFSTSMVVSGRVYVSIYCFKSIFDQMLHAAYRHV